MKLSIPLSAGTPGLNDVSKLDVSGATDLGAAIQDTDLIIVNQRKSAFSRVWTAIKAKIDAGLTIAGVHAFSSTTRPTSAGTGTPASNSLITLADAQSAYGTEYNIFLSADLEAVSTDVVTGAQTITVPAGNYELEAHAGVLTESETGGAHGGFKMSANNDSSTFAQVIATPNISANGGNNYTFTALRFGSSVLQWTMLTHCDAPNKAAVSLTKAFVTLSAETTFSPTINQRTATDASNAAKLLKCSYLKLTKR